MSGIVLPSDAAKEELRAAGMDVVDPAEAAAWWEDYRLSLMGLLRAMASTTLCTMTGQPGTVHVDGEVRWFGARPAAPMIGRVHSYEVAVEVGWWAEWLLMALPLRAPLAEVAARLPPPPPRGFRAPIWGGLARGPEPRLPSKRKTKARRS